MGRRLFVVTCALWAACGTQTDGRRAKTASPVGSDGGTGTASCEKGAAFMANAGTGSGCSLKPVLGSPRQIRIDFTGLPPTIIGCAETYPSDGQGDLLASWITGLGLPPAYSFISYDANANRLGTAADNGPQVFPLEGGWVFSVRAGSPGDDLELRTPFLSLPKGAFLHRLVTYGRGPKGGLAVLSPLGRPLFGLPLYYTAPPDAGPACEQPGTDIADTLFLTRYDPSGVQGPAVPLELGCVSNDALGLVAENAQGDVLAIVGGRLWHLAMNGVLASFPFDRKLSVDETLAPLVDGRFALNEGGASWTATISIDGTVSPPPCWLAATNDVTHFDIVLGGKAYLLYHDARVNSPNQAPCDRYAEVVLADGTSCGFINVTGTATCSIVTVALGLDGTLSALDQASCTLSFWPRAFASP